MTASHVKSQSLCKQLFFYSHHMQWLSDFCGPYSEANLVSHRISYENLL